MKKSNFAALILGTIGVVFFALGMCMALLPEWGMFQQGIVCGVIGLVVLLITVLVWRRMEGKAPIHLNAKTVGAVVVGVLGALLLGVGMCMTMVFGRMDHPPTPCLSGKRQGVSIFPAGRHRLEENAYGFTCCFAPARSFVPAAWASR